MIQAVTCASTKTNVQKVQSIGIGVVTFIQYRYQFPLPCHILHTDMPTLAAALIIALQHTPLLSDVSV